MNNSTGTTARTSLRRSGYDLPVYGLDNGEFINIHAPALACIFISLVSAVAVLTSAFTHQSFHTFCRWSKPERFVVYLALCDGLFNVFHSMDHLHIVISEDHVYPLELCEFYGVMIAEFMTAQHLMVNMICINAFLLIYFDNNLKFGICDWRMLVWVFGLPGIALIAAAVAGVLGPNGVFCYFDGIKGETANIFFTTVPIVVVIALDVILYVLTWWRIRRTEPKFRHQSNKEANRIKASHRAARNMSLFVIAFIIQWWAMGFYGLWHLVNKDVPQTVYQLVTTFSNTGGILNGIVYIIIRRRKIRYGPDKEVSTDSTSAEHSGRPEFPGSLHVTEPQEEL